MVTSIKTSKEIKAVLSSRFNIDSDVQVIQKEREQTLYIIEAVPISSNLTVGEVYELCEEIAKELGGGLYGAVNLDFTAPDNVSFEMIVEVYGM